MAKSVNIFSANVMLSAKELKSAKSETKKALNAALQDYAQAIDAAFSQVVKSNDKKARDCANAAKGTYKTALQVVVNCYPFQTEDGTLCTKGAKSKDDDTKVWKEKNLTAAAARGIVRDSLKCFTDGLGTPTIKRVVLGEKVEK